MVLAQGDNQFIKRRVLLPQNVGADPRLHVGQLAPAWIALTLRRQTACLALQLHHVVDEPHRHAEVRRRGPVRMTFLDEVDYAPAKLDWMRPSHRKPPLVVIPKKGNHKNPSRGNPLNQITSNPLKGSVRSINSAIARAIIFGVSVALMINALITLIEPIND